MIVDACMNCFGGAYSWGESEWRCKGVRRASLLSTRKNEERHNDKCPLEGYRLSKSADVAIM